jgi:hypothetical protein
MLGQRSPEEQPHWTATACSQLNPSQAFGRQTIQKPLPDLAGHFEREVLAPRERMD